MKFSELIFTIEKTHNGLVKQAYVRINHNYTIRNWLIGHYVVEFEQNGEDRAEYGNLTLSNLAKKLKHIKGLSLTNLKLFRQFYLVYPSIGQALPDQLKDRLVGKDQTVLDLSFEADGRPDLGITVKKLITNLSFSHFIELLRVDDPIKRRFYEIETINNGWNIRDLGRAIDTIVFERAGLSIHKQDVIEKIKDNIAVPMFELIKNPYLLEFLGLEEKSEYSEHDLETALINNLQTFLTELGKGFCFEARQKRITFDNTHYRIDLVFYHRILKCHILVDLKLGKFDHADAGQMNLYLNYYKKNEMTEGDNPPVGIILCTDKNDTLVEYTTTGLSHDVFVSKYLVELPSKEILKEFLNKEVKTE